MFFQATNFILQCLNGIKKGEKNNDVTAQGIYSSLENIKFERRRYEQKERDLAIDISRAIGRTRKHR